MRLHSHGVDATVGANAAGKITERFYDDDVILAVVDGGVCGLLIQKIRS